MFIRDDGKKCGHWTTFVLRRPVAKLYTSATSFSERDGRLRDRTRTHPVNVGGAVPHRGEKSNRNAILPAIRYAARPTPTTTTSARGLT